MSLSVSTLRLQTSKVIFILPSLRGARFFYTRTSRQVLRFEAGTMRSALSIGFNFHVSSRFKTRHSLDLKTWHKYSQGRIDLSYVLCLELETKSPPDPTIATLPEPPLSINESLSFCTSSSSQTTSYSLYLLNIFPLLLRVTQKPKALSFVCVGCYD